MEETSSENYDRDQDSSTLIAEATKCLDAADSEDLTDTKNILAEAECRITDEEAVRCALSIPEAYVPTPHEEFIKYLAQSDSKLIPKRGPGLGKPKLSINGGTLIRERERRLRSAFAKYKVWDEAEKCRIEKLGGTTLRVNDLFTVERDYDNYLKEADVELPLDEDWRTCEMPPLPSANCAQENACSCAYCALGCICDSLKGDTIVRKHCGRPKCFFDCTCIHGLFSNGDDGDIRSRLRPRVSLLNWRHLEPEKEKDPPPANYRQLERGSTIYPRMRRVAVAPQRFRNEYVMSHNSKDIFGREKRKAAVGGLAKLLRKNKTASTPHKPLGTNVYRRTYVAKKQAKLSSVSNKQKMKSERSSSSDSITHKSKSGSNARQKRVSESPEPVQPELQVPQLIQMMTEDGQVILLGIESMCFFSWSLDCDHPKVHIYSTSERDIVPIPWLYVPVPSDDETWLFHQVSDLLNFTSYTFIPEINCVIPSKALQAQMNTAYAKKKGMRLKLLWIGEDSKQRLGSLYIFPELPGVLVCGPFPKNQIRTRYGPHNSKYGNALGLVNFVDHMSAKSSLMLGGERTWENFFASKTKETADILKENVSKQKGVGKVGIETSRRICQSLKSAPGEAYSVPDKSQAILRQNPTASSLKLSWSDAVKVLNSRPAPILRRVENYD